MNISTVIRQFTHWSTQAVAMAVLVLLSRSEWALGGLYAGERSLSSTCLALLVLFLLVVLSFALLAMTLPTRLAEISMRILTVAAAIYVFQPVVRVLFFFPAKLEDSHKFGLVAFTLVIAWLVSIKLSPSRWKRLKAALLFGGCLFVSFPLLAVRGTGSINVQMPAGASLQGGTVVLLLDELNADAGEQVAAAIRQAGGPARAHRIKSVGTATISVIPEMFGGPHVPQAAVCTPTAVCDSLGMFDFSHLRFAPLEKVHIIGFHHPYCAAQGLSSCATFAPPSQPSITSLLCSFDRLRVGRQGNLCDWLALDGWLAFRERMRNAAMQSPFWKTGGTLYAHLPFPHPPGGLRYEGLAADYADNIQIAGAIAAEVWTRGHEHFGSGFRMIVTSDHPLRPALWCRHGKYRETGCEVMPTAFEGMVPYILVGGDDTDIPADNAKIFIRNF